MTTAHNVLARPAHETPKEVAEVNSIKIPSSTALEPRFGMSATTTPAGFYGVECGHVDLAVRDRAIAAFDVKAVPGTSVWRPPST